MFGFKPSESVPVTTQSSNVPATTSTTSLFQQNANQTNLPTSSPVFGLIQQTAQPDTNASSTGQTFLFQSNTSARPTLPSKGGSDLDSGTRLNPFKTPFGSTFFDRAPKSSSESFQAPTKSIFSVPNAPGFVSATHAFSQSTLPFPFGSQSSAPFSTAELIKGSGNNKVTFSFGNPEKAASNNPIFPNSNTSVFSSKTNPFGGGSGGGGGSSVFGSENKANLSEGTKPAFSFVKAKDTSKQTNVEPHKNKSEVSKSKPLLMDEESVEKPGKPASVKSRLSMPLKAPILKVTTEKTTKCKPLRSPDPDEISKITVIICKNVPDKYNNKQFLAQHFSKFGEVKTIRCLPKKKDAVVHFFDHCTAKAAKSEGSLLDSEAKMKIFWASVSSKGQGRTKTSSEVDEELMSMGSGGFFEPRLLSRPEALGKERVKKSPVKKKPDGPSSDETLLSELERTATSYGDRNEILDARDKLMRMKLQKQSDINKATAVVGTCPDMCPEKERYSRTEKNCLTLFEQHLANTDSFSTSGMNPKAVVKEYSRSSADQEEPLSHDLRPAHILEMTMDYLVCNIVNTENNAGDWFDFIWNRTRAIRKDITQQHLCDSTCVALVEKCARFHIHCAAAFCHEDISVFDPKINSENLTKCLQTLKHFYHDLSEKGIHCPNEAEFMCYDILLNLNEGDIIRQAQQLCKEVRETEYVRFATEVFFAQNSNNYVRFFRLLRNASYLSACIMQRYFPQVRRKALAALCKAYRIEQFPLADLKTLLAFEDIEEVEQCCNWLQLQTIPGVGVSLRKAPNPTSAAPSITKPSTLINSKRLTSVGEVVNGGPLPKNPYTFYEPHDSFDSDGKLKKDAYNAEDQANKVQKKDAGLGITISSPVSEQTSVSEILPVCKEYTPVIPVTKQYSLSDSSQEKPEVILAQAMNDIMTEICMDTVKMLTSEVTQQTLLEFKQQFLSSVANQTVATIVSDTVNIMSSEVSEEVLNQARVEKQNQENEKRNERVSDEIKEQFLEAVLKEDIYKLAKQTIAQCKQELICDLAENFLSSLLSEVVKKECSSLANHVIQKETDWTHRVQDFIQEKKLQRARKIFQRWHCTCVNRRTFEHVRKTFPSGPLMGFESVKRIKLDGLFSLSIKNQASKTKHVSQLILSDLYYHLLNHELFGLPLNVLSLVRDIFLNQKSSVSLDGFTLWKLVVFTPNSEDVDPWVDLISSKFSLPPKDTYKVVQDTLMVSQPKVHFWKSSKIKLGISTMHVSGNITKAIGNQMLVGLSAVLLPVILHYEPNSHFQEVKAKLQLLLHKKQSFFSVPLVLLLFTSCTNSMSEAETEDELIDAASLNLRPLISTGYISKIKILLVLKEFSAIELTHQLEEAVQWLACNSPESPKLTSAFLEDFVEDGIRTLVLDPVYEDLAYKQKCFNSSLQSPDSILSLYNAAVEFLGVVASSSKLKQLSWPASEFITYDTTLLSSDWNKPGNLQDIKRLITRLKLRQPAHQNYSPITSEEAYDWVQIITTDMSPKTKSIFYNVFERELSQFESNGNSAFPWSYVLLHLFSLLLSDFQMDIKGKAILVRYDPNDMQSFQAPPAWFESTRNLCTELHITQSLATTERKKEKSSFTDEVPKEDSLCSSQNLLLGPEFYLPSEERCDLQIGQQLEQSLKDEKLKSQAYTQWLIKAAEGDNELNSRSSIIYSSFDPPSFERKFHKAKKRSLTPEFLEDSFYLLKKTLENEKESSKLIQANLALLQK